MPIKSSNITSNNIAISKSEDGDYLLRFTGVWKALDSSKITNDIFVILDKSVKKDRAMVDLSGIKAIDTIGAILIVRLREHYRGKIKFQGSTDHVDQMISIVSSAGLANSPDDNPANLESLYDKILRIHAYIGENILELVNGFLEQLYVFGLVINNFYEIIISRRKAKKFISSLTRHLYHIGIEGAPVIILISVVIGAVMAQQCAFQLSHFGVEIFAIDFMSILQIREIGVLLTAVMIAGRSGSAITAEVGNMKMNSEIDAIEVMGIDVVRTIISPRILAIIISLPLLTILANFFAIIGASVVVWIYYNISFSVFFSRLHSPSTLLNFFAGLLKAPFMAITIGTIAFTEGLKVKYDTNSIGKRVTSCVVKSISMVLIIDSLFAIFYFAIGI